MKLHDRDIQRAAKREGIAEGKIAQAIESAKILLQEGDSPEKIARCVGLPLEEIQKMADELK